MRTFLIISLALSVGRFACEAEPRFAKSPDGRQLQQSEATLLIARQGKAELPIVIAPGASQASRAAAERLADSLQKMSGATFEIREETSEHGIFVGTLEEFPSKELASDLEVRSSHDGREAYAIRTETGRLRLIGATERGVGHAVSRFLELQGMRRYFMAPEWEVIPKKSEIQFDANEVSRPAILTRNIWFAFGLPWQEGETQREGIGIRNYREWSVQNRMASSFDVFNAHMYQSAVVRFKDELAAHPEYNALVNGKRDKPGKLCLSQPRAREMIFETAILQLGESGKGRDMVSIEPSDGPSWCECEECAKLGGISDRAFGLANELARKFKAEGRTRMALS